MTRTSGGRLARAMASALVWVLTAGSLTTAVDEASPAPTADTPSVPLELVTEEVEPGVERILHDGIRDLSDAAMTKQPETYAEYLQTHVARSIAAGEDGSVWIFDRDGFVRLGAEGTFDWSHQPRFHADTEIEVAPDGTLWRIVPARTMRSFDGESWTRYRQKQILWGLEAEPGGTMWATWVDTCGADPEGCVPRKVGRLDRRGWTVFDVPRMYAYSGHELAVTASGEAWLCCRRNPVKHEDPGLLRLSDGRWRTARLPDLDQTDGLVLFDASDDGTLWLRRTPDTLERFHDGDWTVFTDADGVPPLGYLEPRIRMRAAPDGSIWITPSVSTGSPDDELKCDGVAHFDGTTWTRYLRDTCVFSMDVATDGALWLQGAKGEIENISLYTLGETVEPVQVFVIRPQAGDDPDS